MVQTRVEFLFTDHTDGWHDLFRAVCAAGNHCGQSSQAGWRASGSGSRAASELRRFAGRCRGRGAGRYIQHYAGSRDGRSRRVEYVKHGKLLEHVDGFHN
jgi:hypothetical protein